MAQFASAQLVSMLEAISELMPEAIHEYPQVSITEGLKRQGIPLCGNHTQNLIFWINADERRRDVPRYVSCLMAL